MKTLAKLCQILLLYSVAQFLPIHSYADEYNCLKNGYECISGGIGLSEREELLKQRNAFSLWVITATEKSGSYLSDVTITVLDQKNKQKLMTYSMNGPWLFVALPSGSYELEAKRPASGTGARETIKKSVNIVNGEHQQAVFYFKDHDVNN